jgi:two-component system, sensor histidine kinase and response regulator
MTEIAQPDEVARRRRQQYRRLALLELPILRVIGLAFASLGIFLNNRYFLGLQSNQAWSTATVVLAAYCLLAWAALVATDRFAARDATLFFLGADMVMWTYAIYMSGAEDSRLFFILLMRVADQTQTTFRRCLAFLAWGTICYASMMAWVRFVDLRHVDFTPATVKLIFIIVSGIYIALTARTAEQRRRQIRDAGRMSRDLIRQLEERSADLHDARAKADEANAAKSEFLANMSHEMRTPLHGVIGMMQLARDGETSPERARHIELAQRSAESLLSTIDDVLEFSRIEARRLELEPVYFSLRQMMRETMKPLGVTAASRGLVLSYSVEHDVPDAVWTDPLRLRQILTNLVGNAIKFTQSGEVAVRIRCERRDGNKLQLHGEVTDTGIGMDASVQRLIFEPFTQVDASRTRRYAGTGLGLSIVSRLVEAMGGHIEVTSQIDEGSRFTFSVVAEGDDVTPAAAASWEEAFKGTVMVVDRYERERAAIVGALRGRGFAVEDFAWFDEVPHERYACFITTEPRHRYSPLVVIASPLQQPAGGVSVTRPVDEGELIEAMGVALGFEQPRATARVAGPRTADTPLRILVVEDNPISQEFATDALRRMGHEVAVASDGLEALQLIRRERFDAVLMDVQMPGMDGLEATRQIRALDSGGDLWVIAMTAHTRPEEAQRCLDAGMNAVLTKPVDRHELAAILGGITPDPIVAAVGGNPKLLARVTAAFVDQTPRLLSTIREAIDRRDAEALYEAAHKLKGSLSNFPTEATEVAAAVEESGRKADFESAQALIPRLEELLRDLEARLLAAVG